MEWKVEEETPEHVTLMLSVMLNSEHSVEFRVLHDKLSGRYILRLVRLRGFTGNEISILSTICHNLDLSLDYSVTDRSVYLTPSPIKYMFTSIAELNQRVQNIIDVLRQIVLYLKDVKALSELVLDLTRENWLVLIENGRVEQIRRTFYIPERRMWIIVTLTPPGMLQAGKAKISLTVYGRDVSSLQKLRKLLTEREFIITVDLSELGFLEACKEVLTIGLASTLVKEVEKLINEIAVQDQ